jgi:SAM-dependent methyltransferase
VTAPAEPFDRALRRRRRDRAAAGFDGFAFIKDAIDAEIAEKVADIHRDFGDVLDLGCFDGRLGRRLGATTFLDAGAAFAKAARGVAADEDRLPFADARFDLVVSGGALHGVNDLPGALAQIRRVLRPDGLFIAGFVGGETLREVRRVLLEAESAVTGRAAARVMPMVDVAAGGALLQRAGFAMPVADVDTVEVRYPSLFAAIADLRGMGETSILHGRPPLRRDVLADAATRFAGLAGPDGKTAVRVQIVYLTGWAPGPDQPKPLAPGSATASLKVALKDRLQ